MSAVTDLNAPATKDLADRIEQLLDQCPPATTDLATLWGAQFDLGLAWVHFPEGLGGLGLDRELQRVVDDRLSGAGVPSNVSRNIIGVRMMAPTVVAFAPPELQSRFLRRAFTCEEIWCQLFSEPGAGSDLASLATRAVRDGEEWVITGQKVWTTLAHKARWAMLLARTDPEVPKHKGLSFFIIDMQAPGVEVRPLRQMTGEAEYNEVFLNDVRVPDLFRLGEVGDGWRVAMTTLMNERIGIGTLGLGERNSGSIKHLLKVWESVDDAQRNAARQDFMRLWTDAEVLRLTRLRSLELADRGTPGPGWSLTKSAACRLDQRIFEMCMHLRGAEAGLIDHYDMTQPDIVGQADSDNYSNLTKAFLAYQGHTIGGGTTEINKTIIAEGVLGLPAEPRPDKNVPWSQVPRN